MNLSYKVFITHSSSPENEVSPYKQRTPKITLRGSENGGYLLSHKRSTIGVAELNDPVRNGKGWDLSAITT